MLSVQALAISMSQGENLTSQKNCRKISLKCQMKPFHLSTQNTEALNCRLCLKDSLNPSFIKAWIWKFALVIITHQPTICSPPQPPTASHLVAREFLPTSNSSQSHIFHFMLIWVLVGLDLSLTLWFDNWYPSWKKSLQFSINALIFKGNESEKKSSFDSQQILYQGLSVLCDEFWHCWG